VLDRDAARPELDRHAAGNFLVDVVGFHELGLSLSGDHSGWS
jgi:hypothetical protein